MTGFGQVRGELGHPRLPLPGAADQQFGGLRITAERLYPALRVVTERVAAPQVPFDFRDVTGIDSFSHTG
jgi:hypothetical protein